MAPKNLTEYERQRLENIKRNDEMLAKLKIRSKINELSSSSKRQRPKTKSYKVSPEKKLKAEAPVVIRRSLRTRGVAPDLDGLKDDVDENLTLNKTPKLRTARKMSPPEKVPLRMQDVYIGDESDRKLIETLLGVSKKSQLKCVDNSKEEIDVFSDNSVDGSSKSGNLDCREMKRKVWGSIAVEDLKLEPDNIARVVQGRIMNVKFIPTADMKMVVVGNKSGNIGFWNVDVEKEDGDGIYVYQPHSGPVSGISIQPFSISKMFTCCYDGFIRLMDVEKEVFDLVHCSDYSIYSISQQSNDVKSLYFSEGRGWLSIWDERTGKSSSSWDLHEDRINTIDFNSENTNIMATSSTDRTVCIWDVRYIDAEKPKSLKTVNHKKAVCSAYFSPSGSFLATASFDDNVGLLTGANYDDISMIYHYNQTGRWISTFRAIWGWDDSYIFIGNMKRWVDVISAPGRRLVAALQSENMSAIPCRFDAHPCNVGMLAGATSGGQVYIWTLS